MFRLLAIALETLSSALFIVPLILFAARKERLTRRMLTLLFSLYTAAVFSAVGLPSVLSHTLDPSINWVPFLDVFSAPLSFLRNELLNILLFMPIGFLAALLWPAFRSPRRTALLGLGLSAFIELSQLFTFRLTDVDDLITNTAGAVAGCLLARFAAKKLARAQPKTARSPRECAALLALTAAVMMLAQPFISDFFWSLAL